MSVQHLKLVNTGLLKVLFLQLLYYIFIGLGDYKLHPGFLHATRSPEYVNLIDIYSLEEILEMIMFKKQPEKCLAQTNSSKLQ